MYKPTAGVDSPRKHLDKKAGNLIDTYLNALWFQRDGSAGWAAGANGQFLRYENGKWQRDAQASEVTDILLTALWLKSDGSSGWAIGGTKDRGGLLLPIFLPEYLLSATDSPSSVSSKSKRLT